MKDIFGIIGGLGPKATVSFINNIINQTIAECDQDHPEFILLNHTTTPDRTAYILDKSMPNPLPYLLNDVKNLADSNVSFIVIPCNTAHYFFDELQNHSPVPIINMISETTNYIKKYFSENKRIGILATPGTLKSNLYQKELQKVDLEPILPTENIQENVNELIFEQVKRGNPIDFKLYFEVLKSMYDHDCEVIILGCTELSFIEQESKGHYYPIVDAQAVLVERTIQLCGKDVKGPNTFEKNRLLKGIMI